MQRKKYYIDIPQACLGHNNGRPAEIEVFCLTPLPDTVGLILVNQNGRKKTCPQVVVAHFDRLGDAKTLSASAKIVGDLLLKPEEEKKRCVLGLLIAPTGGLELASLVSAAFREKVGDFTQLTIMSSDNPVGVNLVDGKIFSDAQFLKGYMQATYSPPRRTTIQRHIAAKNRMYLTEAASRQLTDHINSGGHRKNFKETPDMREFRPLRLVIDQGSDRWRIGHRICFPLE